MHTIRCEIDTEYRDAEALADLAWRWLVEGAERLEGESLQAVLDSTDLVAESLTKSVPCGPPGALWGFFSADTVNRGNGRITHRTRILTRKNLPLLRKWLGEDILLAETALYRLDEHGMPGDPVLRMAAAREEKCQDWVRLSALTPKGRFGSDGQARWGDLLRDHAQELDPSYAQIGYDRTLGRTEHEERVGPPLPRMTLPQSRRFLRGYEWLMVVPREIVQQLGGAEAIRAAGFHRVEELPGGAVLLQAVPEFDGFTGEAVERLWQLVRPALRPGMPKRFSADTEAGDPPSRIWYADTV
ncbi:hypothetical protein RMN57_30215 [Kitasatospora sp. CM 4170]|uniref:Uncharacterized protein n=1 Tax=Kitasatospora aburaviensis TaxID=67265 RepID=A0ABW1ENX2_9ACTN|nr:hypothetical protein [Kitasatospora sp. CM 4170]WNM48665.1 hypothetical protein RMN57_30215 [Kitasatospora sp. CM 4170]